MKVHGDEFDFSAYPDSVYLHVRYQYTGFTGIFEFDASELAEFISEANAALRTMVSAQNRDKGASDGNKFGPVC